MKKIILLILLSELFVGCASFWSLFRRHDEVVAPAKEEVATSDHRRTTRKTLEDESLLGEQSGSLWVSRGQSSFLFANNNQRLIGDLLNIRIEGYPKEQVQTKVNVISKLLAEILNEQKEEIQLKQEELKKQLAPENELEGAPQLETRGLASVIGATQAPDENDPQAPDPQKLIKQQEKELRKIGEEQADIQSLAKGKEFPIRMVPTRIVDIQKDGNYRIRGEQPFMIGKREYKLLVMGTVRAEEYDEKGMSAEALLDPVFDIISEKKSGDL